MKSQRKEITTLTEDIQQIVLQSKEKDLDIARFSYDHTSPILSFDQKPVFKDIGLDQFLGIFDLASNHYFITPEETSRFAFYFKLDLPPIIALMIKSSWEIYFSEMIGYGTGEGIDFEQQVKNRETITKYLPEFKLRNRDIYDIMIKIPYKTDTECTRLNVNNIINMLVQEEHFLAEHNHINKLFPRKGHTEKTILLKATSAQKAEYLQLKERWRSRSAEFENKLLLLEKKKRNNTNVVDNYYRTFGKLLLNKADLNYRQEKYEKLLDLKKSYPTLTCRDLLKMAIELISDSEKRNNKLRAKYARSLNCLNGILVKGSDKNLGVDLFNYDAACKKTLKQLYFLLHPDKYKHRNLSEDSKKKLHELWLEVMKISEELRSFTPDLILYTHPDYYHLVSILKKVCEILEIDMADLEVSDQLLLMINQGASIQRLIEFLKEDLENQQLHLSNLELNQFEYANDKKTLVYSEALLDEGAHKEKLESEIAKIRKEITILKAKISLAFKRIAV